MQQSNSPTKPLVYNAPALLPTFTPALGQNKINNNLLPVNPSEYEQWLSTQRSGIAEKAWLIKGNTEGFNYSAYEFGGERSPSLSLSTTGYEDASLHSHRGPLGNMLSIDTSSHPSSLPHAQAFTAPVSHSHQLTAVPAPLPERILLEVHTVNQMIRTDRLEEDKHIMRSIDSHVTLSELKGLITEDIIQGIERAFRLYSDSVPPSQRHQHTDYTRVELNFQCFVPLVGTWRAMATETDWTLAKQNCRNEQNVIKLMYALEKNSEFLLLKEIQQSYQKQRQKANLQAAPQISLQSLTESMEKNLRLKKKYVYDDSPPMTSSSTQRPTAGLNGAPVGSSQQLAASKSVNFLPQARSISMPSRSQGSSLDRNGSKSIHALLDSLNKSDPFREEHRLGHANGMNDSTYSNGGLNANSLLGGSSMYTSSVPSSASSAAGGVLGGSPSIFYPKRSHTLDKMYEELESSMPRQQNFANNLEQRLFKTRW